MKKTKVLTWGVALISAFALCGCSNEAKDKAAGEATKTLIENAVNEMEEMHKVTEVPESTESPESTETLTEVTADVGTNNPDTLTEIPLEDGVVEAELNPDEGNEQMPLDNTPGGIDFAYFDNMDEFKASVTDDIYQLFCTTVPADTVVAFPTMHFTGVTGTTIYATDSTQGMDITFDQDHYYDTGEPFYQMNSLTPIAQ